MAKRILVVDDRPNIVRSLRFLMEQEGYTVSVAENGVQSLEAVEANFPDLVLLNVNMPEPNGFEVCQILRANPDYRNIKILIVTAKWRDVDREKSLALGADDYIVKPFATSEVVSRVAELLQDQEP